MNSEKVKEIKKALGDNAKTVSYADILTLINELEKENKRLKRAINNVQKGFDNGEFISKDCKISGLKQFAERLKEKVHNYYPSIDSYCTSRHVILVKDVDELLKEYEQ